MSTGPQRLPRGRHGLSREEVVASQRERILRAMADAMAERGFVGTSVADVLRTAGVSRETFYQQFSSKEDCFMVAYDAAVGIILEGIGTSVGGGDAEGLGRFERIDQALGSYLEAVAAEPAFARVFLLEVYAAGPAALAHRAAGQQRFVALVAALFGADDEEGLFMAEALVAATSSLVTSRLAANDLDAIRALRRPLVRLAGQLVAAGTAGAPD
ncbi:TetR/AcrR family transcriptional regulator [Paraconexibacter sp. AEG42_29]|uniref:TetR/AcrR family transcriptional regulator n=1 Tax=Paraconexibacter sp. AEG42_29 TaxID=2997339 RepID=UPI00339D3BB5